LPTDPFRWLPETARWRLFAALTVLFLGTSAWLSSMGRALVTPAAPHGIVSFELAYDVERSRAILAAWSDEARAVAVLIQGFDYLYLVVYPAWLSLAAALAGSRLGEGWRRAGSALSWAVLGSAPLDAVENYALIQQLLHGPTQHDAAVAWWCAVPKFALVVCCGLFVMVACARRVVRLAAREGRAS